MLVREYRKKDAAAVYDIISSCLDEYYRPELLDYITSQWSKGQLVCVDNNDVPIGFLASDRLDNFSSRILMFAVLPQFRNMGIGQTLMNSFRTVCIMNGIKLIMLEVRIENKKAIRFYLKNGFSEKEIIRSYYRNGGAAVRMIGQALQNN